METHFLHNLQKWLTKYLKYSKSVTFTSRQRLRRGDVCLRGLKARLLQHTPQNHLQAGAAGEEHDCSRALTWAS